MPLLLLIAAGGSAADGTAAAAAGHNLTGVWTSDSTPTSGKWTDRYALTELGSTSVSVLCESGGVPASCSKTPGGGGGGWHTATVTAMGVSLTITFDFGLTHHGTLNANATGITWTEDSTHWKRVGSRWVPPVPAPTPPPPPPTPTPPPPTPAPPAPPGPPPTAPRGYTLVGVGNCLPNTPNIYDYQCPFAECAATCANLTLCTGYDWTTNPPGPGSCRARFPIAPKIIPPAFTLDPARVICSNVTGSNNHTVTPPRDS